MFIERKDAENMSESDKEALRWHFWFLVSTSLLIVLTVVYYLPTRFLYDNTQHEHGEMIEHHDEMMGGHDESATDHEHAPDTPADHAHDEGGMMEHMDEMMHDEEGGGEHAGHAANFHEIQDVTQGITVTMSSTPRFPRAGEPVLLSFDVALRPQNAPVSQSTLEVSHEKKMHVIGARKDLSEFFHIHPSFDPSDTSRWSVSHTFANPGEYKIWPEVTYQGATHIFGEPLLMVTGTGAGVPATRDILKNVIVGQHQVTIKYGTLGIGENPVRFLVSDLLSQHVDLDNFIGAKMHLAVISEDLTQYVHAHPETLAPAGNGPVIDESQPHTHSLLKIPQAYAHAPGEDIPLASEADELAFTLSFTKPGLYKAFAQFRPRDAGLAEEKFILAEFWLNVQNAKPVPYQSPSVNPFAGLASSWWLKLVISLILMALLSIGVKRYLVSQAPVRVAKTSAPAAGGSGAGLSVAPDLKNKYFAVIGVGILIVTFGIIYRGFFIAEEDKPVVTGIVREMTIVADKNEWRFTPEELTVDRGDKVVLTVVNEDDYDHGLAIDAFGISQRMPAEETIKIEFVATQAGEFPYYCSVPCGEGDVPGEGKRTHFDMVGRIKVRDVMRPGEMMNEMMNQ